MKKRITAVVCTFDRPQYLRKVVSSLANQSLASDEFEIIVVNNSQRDRDLPLIESEFAHVPNLIFLHEPKLGLSFARNRGWQNAKGEYVAFIDDDGVADPKWLESACRAFEKNTPQTGCVGGRIHLIWEAPQPSWLSDQILDWVGYLDWGNQTMIIDESRWLGGSNVVYRRTDLAALGGFSTELGRKGDKLLANEETLVQRQLRLEGKQCLFDPSLLTYHHVPEEKLSHRWFMRRAYWQGVSNALSELELKPRSGSGRLLRGVKRMLSILFSKRELKSLLLSTQHPQQFMRKCFTVTHLGSAMGYMGFKD